MIVLNEGKPSIENRRVVIARDEMGYNIKPIDPVMSFKQMAELRKRGVSEETIDESLNSAGHVFANLGVSSVLTMNYAGQVYLLTVRQDRPDFGDSVAKLVSGYVDTTELPNPFTAMLREISEEVLPIEECGRLARFYHQGFELENPFPEYFKRSPLSLNLLESGFYQSKGLGDHVFISGRRLSGDPAIYFHAPTNSAQLVFNYNLVSSGLLEEHGISMQHNEDKMVDGKLKTLLHPEGIYLIALRDGELTDQVATMKDGILRPVDPRKVVLSEVFVPKKKGIVTANNISLIDYLEK